MSQEKPHYQGHRSRLRERLARDATGLADYEILELTLGLAQLRKDTKPLAKDLLRRFGGLRGAMDARAEELLSVPGFNAGTLALWKLLREIMARYVEAPLREREVIADPGRIAEMARMRLAACSHEEIWAALLDAGKHLLAWARMSEGTIDASALCVRNLLEQVVLYKASGIILVHNHPGGSDKPSGADIETTRRLSEAAFALGITVYDHLIVSEAHCVSFREEGLLR
jgi:DNA repair protein RadC